MPWWNPADLNIPVIGEIKSGNGRAMTCTAPGFNWVNANVNGATEQANLQNLTANMLNYLQAKTEILLLGDAATLSAMPHPSKTPTQLGPSALRGCGTVPLFFGSCCQWHRKFGQNHLVSPRRRACCARIGSSSSQQSGRFRKNRRQPFLLRPLRHNIFLISARQMLRPPKRLTKTLPGRMLPGA